MAFEDDSLNGVLTRAALGYLNSLGLNVVYV